MLSSCNAHYTFCRVSLPMAYNLVRCENRIPADRTSRSVCVRDSGTRECGSRKVSVYLMLTAAYGLVNENDRWKVQYDQFMTGIGFVQVPLMPHLFYLVNNYSVSAMLSKTFEEFII